MVEREDFLNGHAGACRHMDGSGDGAVSTFSEDVSNAVVVP